MQNLKGTKDFMPEEQLIRKEIINKIENVFKLYGCKPIETPTLCYLELLTSKYAGGAEIIKEIYQLKDQGNREIGLRYDLTVPFAKLIGLNKDLRMPFKRYEIGKVFRDGPVKLGRLREFYQCDVDVVGIKSMAAEAEMMEMAITVFKSLGLEVVIQYNNRKLIAGFLELMGVATDKINSVILILDKIEKIGEPGVRTELQANEIGTETIDRIFDVIMDKSKWNLKFYKENYNGELISEGISEIEELEGFVDVMEIGNKLKFNPFLARGLEIYTGTVYEIFLEDGAISSSIGGGGRYDKIIGNFLNEDKEYPGVGISFGLDVIFTAFMLKGMVGETNLVDILIIPLGTEKQAMALSRTMREAGYRVEVDMMGRKLKKALEYANKEKIPYVIILGEDEVKQGVINIKNMTTGEQRETQISDIGKIEL